MAIITLKEMKFHAFHGCFDFEKEQGNTFYVTVKMEVDIYLAGITDNLEDTLNYQEVYKVVKHEMEIPSNLIEHVARRIHTGLETAFPQVKKFEVALSKMNPPLGGEVERVMITL